MSSRCETGQTSRRSGVIADHTGLFVSWEKSHLLIQTIQYVLRNKFKTFAKIGTRLPNNTAEIILYSQQSAGANISGAKHLVESYLKMIQESRPNILIEKKVEVIELDVDESIPCINLDDCINETVSVPTKTAITGSSSQSEQNKCSTRTVGGLSQNVSVESQDTSTIDSSVTETVNGTSDSSEISNRKEKRKRKHSSIDVVEILDDDVIVLDDSLSESHKKLCTSLNNVENCVRLIDLTENSSSVVSLDESINKPPYVHTFHKTSNTSCISNLSSPALLSLTSTKNYNNYKNIESPSEPSTSAGYKRSIDFTKNAPSITSGTESNNKPNKINIGSPHQKSPNISNLLHTQTTTRKNNNSTKTSPKPSTSATETTDGNKTSPDLLKSTHKVSKLKYKRPAHLVVPLTTSSKNSTVDSQSNIYNPHASLEEKKTGLRPIVIDGNNVAIGHGKGLFSLKGLEICINYFEKRGHRQIKAFIPHYRTNRDTFEGLRRLEKQGTVVVTPSRKVDGKVVASYDDRFIVQYASEFGGVIVSSDNFRDLLLENPSWKETIERRLLMFTWVDDLLMFPQDPLGRNGPTLDEFLKFPD